MNKDELRGAVFAALFVAGEAVEVSAFADLFDMDPDELNADLQEMIDGRRENNEGLLPVRVGDKIQLCTNPRYAGYIDRLLAPPEPAPLSKSVLETLSIIAYKQPVTRSEIDEIRGVRSNYAVAILMEKGMVRVIGRKNVLGRPMLYATTDEFLRHFAISSLEELPEIDFETVREDSPDILE